MNRPSPITLGVAVIAVLVIGFGAWLVLRPERVETPAPPPPDEADAEAPPARPALPRPATWPRAVTAPTDAPPAAPPSAVAPDGPADGDLQVARPVRGAPFRAPTVALPPPDAATLRA